MARDAVTPPPFVVFGLPRSRTFWLSKFLTYRPWWCGHDEIRHMRGFDDVRSFFAQPCVGTIETAAAPWWRSLPEFAGDCRIATIRRPVDEVIESLRVQGFNPDGVMPLIRRFDRSLDQIEARLAGTMRFEYAALADQDTAEALFEHCTGMTCPVDWFAGLAPLNLQCDITAMVRYAQAFGPQMTKFAKMAAHRTVQGMRFRTEPDDVTIREEPFGVFLRDAGPLLDDHMLQIDEAPDYWRGMDLGTMQRIYDEGRMQMMVARSNGRIFGYLQTVTGPSLEFRGQQSAMHLGFYASPLVSGLGLRLQHAAADALAAKGVHDVIMRDGMRGSGGRINALYRRMGATEFGQLYKLDLKAA